MVARSVTVCYDERGNALCFSQSSFFVDPKGAFRVFRLARSSRLIQNWPLGCVFFFSIGLFCFACMRNS